jgi:allophanate hydrolase subunit 2
LEVFGLVEVQGAQRYGVRRFGVPVGGWFDRESAMVANTLVGRPADSPCLELTLAQMRFHVSEGMALSIAGAPSEVTVNGASMGCEGLFWCEAGSEIQIRCPTTGARSYLSAHFSKLESAGTRLVKGLVVGVSGFETRRNNLRLTQVDTTVDPRIRIVKGPQASGFDLSELVGKPFTVSPTSNRVGIRLEERLFPHLLELPSEPAGFGAIQVTPDGTLIILGPDGPTIGGYPKIGYVISADLDRLAQLRPGVETRFSLVELDEARGFEIQRTLSVSRRLLELSLAAKWL